MYDVHTHFVPPRVIEWLRENQIAIQAKWIKKDPAKADFLSVNGKWEFELKESFVNPELYLAEQEKAGIRHSLVSPIPQLFLYELAPAVTQELATIYNDSLSEWTRKKETRLSALASLPMNDPVMAARELERAMDLGLLGAIIATSWEGNLLGDEKFTPFWEVAHARNAIVFVHPLLSEDPRLNRRMMPNLIGVPWETTVCATDLLLSGTMDRYPDAKVLLAHGGGFFPYQVGRLQTGYAKWKAVSGNLRDTPRETAKRFWYDSVLWNQEALAYLIEMVGEERVVPGTDFPFDLCEWPPAIDGTKAFHRLIIK